MQTRGVDLFSLDGQRAILCRAENATHRDVKRFLRTATCVCKARLPQEVCEPAEHFPVLVACVVTVLHLPRLRSAFFGLCVVARSQAAQRSGFASPAASAPYSPRNACMSWARITLPPFRAPISSFAAQLLICLCGLASRHVWKLVPREPESSRWPVVQGRRA